MERLLSILFSVTLLMATAPPKIGSGCSYSGGICVSKESCAPTSESSCSLGHNGDSSKKPACPMPICCVCGPCCCLCLMPERPVLQMTPLPDEEILKPSSHRVFQPQQVWLTVWKPPAFSV